MRSTTKEARASIRNYILDHYTPAGYDNEPAEGCKDFATVARFIYSVYQSEEYYSTQYMLAKGMRDEEVFTEWCRGLPSILDTCYYYSRSAVDDVKAILHQTDAEARRYTERDAEAYLTHLIYREIRKEV